MFTKKPAWFDKKLNLKDCHYIKSLIADLNLQTVCEEASCPNISECFSKGEATFLILGDICTRNCRFCGVKKGIPPSVDGEEPERIAEAVVRLNLRHIVITSVTRDDLPYSGAEIFAKTIFNIRKKVGQKKISIEVLIPDFKGDENSIKIVTDAKPDIIGHNIETIPRLYNDLRQGADYFRTLRVLEKIKTFSSHIYTKSGLMLGLSEEKEEVIDAFSDLRKVGCDFLSIGQYLAPTLKHYPVRRYIHPEKFIYYRRIAEEMGFLYVLSGPYVRSSYRAAEYMHSKSVLM